MVVSRAQQAGKGRNCLVGKGLSLELLKYLELDTNVGYTQGKKKLGVQTTGKF